MLNIRLTVLDDDNVEGAAKVTVLFNGVLGTEGAVLLPSLLLVFRVSMYGDEGAYGVASGEVSRFRLLKSCRTIN